MPWQANNSDTRPYRKPNGQPSRLCFMGYLLTKNRRRLIADVRTTPATGRAGCEMAKMTMMAAAQDAGQCSARIRLDRGRRRAAQDPASRPSPGWTDGHVDGAACNRVRLPKQVANAA